MRYLLAGSLALLLAFAGRTAGAEPVCIQCHDSDLMKPEYRQIPAEWRQSWHARNGVACNDCHGGDPNDAAMAMSPQRGFVGAPAYQAVPAFCGKCHVGILKNYSESGHGRALKATGGGPNCVTCHGAHNVSKASIEIINEERCSQCHTYERARIMKQALFATEQRIRSIDAGLKRLSAQGIYTGEEEKTLFRTEAEFRTLFHTVNVALITEKTDGFGRELAVIEKKTDALFTELRSRRNYAGMLFLLFAGGGVAAYLLARMYR